MSNLGDALEAWSQAIGQQNVITDRDKLALTGTATFATTQSVLGIIRPANRAEVQECVRIANRYSTPIYPISRGRNYGYGSQVPSSDDCVVMDLGRLNRIVDYNEQLGYVVVEPGVTLTQLRDYLAQKGSNLICNVTGSSPDSSFVGNMLERGVGQGPNSDRFAHVCGLEVVLPTGDTVHTGFGRFANAKATSVHRWGVGPYLDGLFTQSNLGVVTQMAMHLLPKPKYFQTFFFTINDEGRLGPLVDTILQLRLAGLIVGGYTIYNDYRMVSLAQQYPWAEVGDVTPLPEEYLRRAQQKAWGGATWVGIGSLHTAGMMQGIGVRRLVRRSLKPRVDGLTFFDPISVLFVRLLRLFSKDPKYQVVLDSYFKSHFLGNPIQGTLRQLYWRKRTAPNPADLDPDRDRCGALWCAPAVPATGKDIQQALAVIKSTISAHRFEPNIGLNWAQDRCIDITACIHYDRDVDGEDERASACYHELLQKLMDVGYYPYRLGVQGQGEVAPPSDDYGKLISTLKRALDPNDILAPGRYDFRAQWPEPASEKPTV